MIEETTLWEGNVGTSNATQYVGSTVLADSLLNYDTIRVYITCYNSAVDRRVYSREFTSYDFNKMKSISTTGSVDISFAWGYGSFEDYVDITKTSTDTVLQWAIGYSYLTKIVGIKYKTFQP